MILRRVPNWPRWDWRDPFDELERMRRHMDRLFEGLSGRLLGEPAAGVFPLVNVTESSGNYYVRAELPGVKPVDMDISVTGTSLSISGERKMPPEDEKANYHRREREAGKFNRMINLPGQIDTSKVEAHFTDGVLTVELPKLEAVKPKQITIKTK
jgi:HSP20 family protein